MKLRFRVVLALRRFLDALHYPLEAAGDIVRCLRGS